MATAAFDLGDRVAVDTHPGCRGTVLASADDPAHATCCVIVDWDDGHPPVTICTLTLVRLRRSA